MAFVRDDLVALDKAIASGEMEVRFNDKSVRYQTIDSMLKARRMIVAEIQQTEGVTRKPRGRTYTIYQRGR